VLGALADARGENPGRFEWVEGGEIDGAMFGVLHAGPVIEFVAGKLADFAGRI